MWPSPRHCRSRSAAKLPCNQQRDFQGEGFSLDRQATDLEKTGFYDGASSIVVRSGVWEACSAAFFDGSCVRLGPGKYSQLDGSLQNPIISVREFANASAAPPATIGAVAEPRIALSRAARIRRSNDRVETNDGQRRSDFVVRWRPGSDRLLRYVAAVQP